MLNREIPYDTTSQWMKMFRENEIAHPIRNGEIVKVTL
jgi:hypothetical protein